MTLAETVGGAVNILELNLQRVLWGSTRELQPNETETLAYVQVSNWQAKTFSIAVSVEALEDIVTAGVALAGIAIVSWGNDGGRHQVEVDISQGTLFSVNASNIQVAVKNTTSLAHSFSASLAPAPIGIVIPPTLTEILDFTVGGNTRTVLIPAFAQRLRVIRFPLTAPFALLQRAGVLGGLGERLVAASTNLDISWPIVNQATNILVTDTVPGSLVNVSMIFELGL